MTDGVGGKPLLEARVRLRADGSALGTELVSETRKATQQASAVASKELSKGYKEGATAGAKQAVSEVRKAGEEGGKQFGEGFTATGQERIRSNRKKLAPSDADAAAAGQGFGKKFGAKASSAIGEELTAQGKGLAQSLVAGFAIDRYLGVVKESVQIASDLNEVGSALNVTFGARGAADIQAWSASTAKGFGLSRLAAAEANQQFGIFAKSAGLTGDKAVDFSTKLTGLAGDLTSFYNPAGGTTQAIEAIGAALRGESEPIRSFGVLLDDATLRQEALRLGIVKTTKDALTPQQRVLAAYSQILKQTADAQGDFARTADSAANSERTLGNQFSDTKASIGQELLPAYTSATNGLRDLLTEYNKIPDGGLTGKLKLSATGVPGAFVAFQEGVRDYIGKPIAEFIHGAPKVSQAAAEASSAVGKVVTSMGENSGAAARAATATARLSVTYDGTAAAAAKLDEEQKVLADTLLKSPFLEQRDAARAYQEALDAAAQAAKDNGKGLDITGEKGRANEAALDGLAKSALAYLDAINAQSGPGKRFQAALKQERADLIAAGIRFGKTRADAEKYADQILAIPRRAVTEVNILNWKQTYDRLTGLVTRVNQLDGRTVTVRANAPNVREDRFGSSTGGPVPGPPSEVDTEPYMLARGEYVVRSRYASTPRNRALLEAMNAGRDIAGMLAPTQPAALSGDGGALADLTAAVRSLVAHLRAQGPGQVLLDGAAVGRLLRSGGGLAGIDAGGW